MSDITIKKLPHSQIEFEIEISPDIWENSCTQALKKLAKHLNIHGFRPGHVPPEIAKEKLPQETLEEETLNSALPPLFFKTVQEQKILAVGTPKAEITDKKLRKVKFTVDVFPEIEIGDYKKIKIAQKKNKLTDKEVDDFILNMRREKAEFIPIELPAAKGHRLTIDFEGFSPDGKKEPGTASKDHIFIVGEGKFIPGFEENIIGLKTEEEKDFEVVFPNDYHEKKLAGNKIKFHVKLNKVEEIKMPPFDEEFVERESSLVFEKKLEKKASIAEFKAEIKKQLIASAEKNIQQQREDEALDKLLEMTKIDLPKTFIEKEIDSIMQEIKTKLKRQGVQFEDYLKYFKKTEEEIRTKQAPEAESKLKLHFAVHEIIKKEKIEASQDEIKEEWKKIANEKPFPEKDEKLTENLSHMIKITKVINLFLN